MTFTCLDREEPADRRLQPLSTDSGHCDYVQSKHAHDLRSRYPFHLDVADLYLSADTGSLPDKDDESVPPGSGNGRVLRSTIIS